MKKAFTQNDITSFIVACINASEADGHEVFASDDLWENGECPEIAWHTGSEIAIKDPDGREYRVLIKRARKKKSSS